MTSYKTEQENFWSGEFGVEYIERNQGEKLLAANLSFFSKALRCANPINSCIEFGPNVGMNLKALKLLYPSQDQYAVEINKEAASKLATFVPADNIFNESLLEFKPKRTWDLSLIKGVLIHINPDALNDVYKMLYKASNRYILICEYYNPTPVSIPYRGYQDRLFKRDFCGEMLDQYSDLKIVDYGFAYHRDFNFPMDDINWFLLEKVK
ncbi:pseudaminic acid biosynthesis-associated methylase [Polynucleobacter paneuropaeus]|nr:pseudaminic acid biosynthesis-associated methylase [Polynucleobacter paneuropaeus]